jgi:hypothetical protein
MAIAQPQRSPGPVHGIERRVVGLRAHEPAGLDLDAHLLEHRIPAQRDDVMRIRHARTGAISELLAEPPAAIISG